MHSLLIMITLTTTTEIPSSVRSEYRDRISLVNTKRSTWGQTGARLSPSVQILSRLTDKHGRADGHDVNHAREVCPIVEKRGLKSQHLCANLIKMTDTVDGLLAFTLVTSNL